MQSVTEATMMQLFRVFPGMEYCDLKHDHVTGLSKVCDPVQSHGPRSLSTSTVFTLTMCRMMVEPGYDGIGLNKTHALSGLTDLQSASSALFHEKPEAGPVLAEAHRFALLLVQNFVN